MDATLVIIGVNFHSSPVAVRERFWIAPDEQVDTLQSLVRSEGVDEVVVLATCARTEFILWASDATEGANSLLRFLTRKFDLKLTDWSNFYRLVDNTALLHLFRLAAGLDSFTVGEAEISGHLRNAWLTAQRADTSGRFLDVIIQKSLDMGARVKAETPLSASPDSVSGACVELGMETFGALEERPVLLLGAGNVAEAAARNLHRAGARKFAFLDSVPQHAERLATAFNGRTIVPSQLIPELAAADLVIAAASSAAFVLDYADLSAALKCRQSLPLVLVDLAFPRNVDPEVRSLTGVYLYNLDDIAQMLQRNSAQQRAAVAEAEKILSSEVPGFQSHLLTEQDLPTITALRKRLEEICGQELRSLEDQFGPFTEDQQHALHSLASHITQRIAGGMARKLKEMPEQADQEQLTEAVQRLFHLEMTRRATPTRSN
ncbi:MAG TPA: glutamyl-tRNA reductase [Terriglobales bacterium]|nr:glutamyl-tRNA reductase [Terriglobales bacterium]